MDIKNIIESLARFPDKWKLLDNRSDPPKVAWVRIHQPGDDKRVDVALDGSIQIGQYISDKKKLVYVDIPIGYFERRNLKYAVEQLLREKAIRIVDRATLDTVEKEQDNG